MTMSERRERQRKSLAPRRSDERWKQILAGSARVFREKGYAATSLRDVSAEVGIDRATLYYYVGSKEELLIELIREPMLDIERRIKEIAKSSDSPAEKIRRAMVSHMESFEAGYPESFIFLAENLEQIQSDARGELEGLARRYHKTLAEIIREGQDAGALRDDLDPVLVMHGLLGMSNWVHRWYRPEGRLSLPEVGDTFATLVLAGLEAKA